MELGLQGRVALVGASSRGLGRAVAEELGAEGADLVICARTEGPLEAARDALAGATGRRVVAVTADLSEAEGVKRVLEGAMEAFGRVDVLVTNNGGPPPGPFEEHDLDAWRRAVAQLLESAVGLIHGVIPGMKERAWGRIVNITSIAVKQPVDGLILSNSIRAAVTGMARTLANEVGAHGITVNNVMPGYTRTERLEELAESIAQERGVSHEEAFGTWTGEIPMGRIGEPSELAALVAFLCSERAGYLTGTSIPVDGGWIRGLL